MLAALASAVPRESHMGELIILERERAVRELRAAVGPEEAEEILEWAASLAEWIVRDPVLRRRVLEMMEREER